MFVVLNISDSDKHFQTAQDEYIKRLGKSVVIDTIKPSKNGSVSQIIKSETEKIISKIQKKYTDYDIIIMSIEGKQINTDQFVNLVQKNNKKKVFLIGGPYGMDENMILKTFSQSIKISFGYMTMPHGLAKLVLLEQIYRANCIESGKKYHY